MAIDDWRPGPDVDGAGGVRIATWDLGGEGPPLLLLHATGFHARMWLPLAPALRSDHRIWAIDQRGHGDSGHDPSGSYRDWSRFVDDALAVVDTLGLGDARSGLVAAGHSLGGAVLLLAEQRRPGLLRSIYCYEPIVLSPEVRRLTERQDVPLARVAAKRRATFASRREARANYASKAPFSAFDPAALDAYVLHGFKERDDGRVELACRPSEEATVYEGAPRHDAWEHLGDTRAAVTLAGSTSDAPPAALLAAAAARLPHARLQRYASLSHFGPMEDPLRIGADIAAAVGRPDGTGRPGGSPRPVTPDG